LEQALNDELKGTPGELKAITDAQGVPLAANKDNVITEPQSGDRVILTIDIGMQQRLEEILKQGLDHAKSQSGSAFIMDVNSGAIKAMANYPTYNPAEFYKVSDPIVFNNPVVSGPLEVGSIMKPLTAAAAIDLGVISKNTSYFDPGRFQIGDAAVTNVEEDGGAGTRTIADILQLSLNTGATWMLMQMGGGQINQQARERWHDYMTNHYQFGKPTGVEQGFEAAGTIPDPNDGFGLDITYANTAFGQGMTATPLQMGAALASIINGGTYYKPRLVEKTVDSSGKETVRQPVIVRTHVVKPAVGRDIKELMEYVVSRNYYIYGMNKPRAEFSIGGKTGTAQIAKPGGGYYEDKFNGLFTGFVGGDKPQYVIVIRVNEPKLGGYAGAQTAAPIFGAAADMLIDNFGVTPKQAGL
jgi:cell division protein FtsI/penicillin-binding protein 2